MADLLRVVLCWLVLGAAAVAAAAVPVEPTFIPAKVYTGKKCDGANQNCVSHSGTSLAAVCAAFVGFKYRDLTSGMLVIVETGLDRYSQCGFRALYPNGGFGGGLIWVTSSDFVCPENSHSMPDGKCACATNYEEKDRACVRKPINCEPGSHLEQGACVMDGCKDTEKLVNGICVPSPPCPEGQARINGNCKSHSCKKGDSPDSVGETWFEVGSNLNSRAFSCEKHAGSNCMVSIRPVLCGSNADKTECFGPAFMTGQPCDSPGKPGNGGNGSDAKGQAQDDHRGDGKGNSDDRGRGQGKGAGTGDGQGQGDGKGSGSGGTKGTSTDSNKGTPAWPQPIPVAPSPDTGKCPPGTSRYGDGNCYTTVAPTSSPDDAGKCPPGMVKLGMVCATPRPAGGPVPDTGTPANPHPVGDPNGSDKGKDKEKGDGKGDGDGSNFGGACASGFVCNGDAIQCAIVQDQHRRSCKLFEDSSPESNLYNTSKGKDGNQTGSLPGNESISLAGRIDSSDALGAGAAGVADLNVVVWGRSITLPLSRLNTYLAALGNVLLAVSFLLATRIIARG